MPPFKRGRHRRQPVAAATLGEKVYPVVGNDRFMGTQEDPATPSSVPDVLASQRISPPLVVYTSRRKRSSWKARIADSDLRQEMLPPPDLDDQGNQKLADSLKEIKRLRKRKRSNSAKPGSNPERESSISGGKQALKTKGPGQKVRAKSVLGSLLFAEVNEAPKESAHETLEPAERARFKNVLCQRDGLSEYLECRNFITSIWERDRGKSISLAECGVTLSSSKEDTAHTRLLREVFVFLDDNGYINSSTSASESKPRVAGRPKGSKNRKSLPKALEFGRGGSRRGRVFNAAQSQRTAYDGAQQSVQTVRQVLNRGSFGCKSDVQLALEREEEPIHERLEFNCERMDVRLCETANDEKIEPEIEPGSSKENTRECEALIRGEAERKMARRTQVGEEPKCVIDTAPLETSRVNSSPLGNLVKKFSRRSKSKKRDSEMQLEMVPAKRVNLTPEGTLPLRNSLEIPLDKFGSRASVMDAGLSALMVISNLHYVDLGAGIETRLLGDAAFDSSSASCNDVDANARSPLGLVTTARIPAKATLVADSEPDGLLDVEEELAPIFASRCRSKEKILSRGCGYRHGNCLEILSKQPAGNLHLLNCYSDAKEHEPRSGPLVGGSVSQGELLIYKVDEANSQKSNFDGNQCSSKRHVDILPHRITDDWMSQVGGKKFLVVHAGKSCSFLSSNLIQIRSCLSKQGIVAVVPSGCYGVLSKVVIEPPLVFCVKILVNSMESKTGLSYSRAASGYPIMGTFFVEGSVARLVMEGCYDLSSFRNLSQDAIVRDTSTHSATNSCLITSTPQMCREVSMRGQTGDCLHFYERIQLIRAFTSGAQQALGSIVHKKHLFLEGESRGVCRRIENSEAAELNDRSEGGEVSLEVLKPLNQEVCSSSDGACGELVGSVNGVFVCNNRKDHEQEVKPLILVSSKDAHVESDISKPPGAKVLEHLSGAPDSVEHGIKTQSTEHLTMAVANVDRSRNEKQVHVAVDPWNRGQIRTDDRATLTEFTLLGSFSDVARDFGASAGRELKDSVNVDPLLGTAEEGDKEVRVQATACVSLEDNLATRMPVIKSACVGSSVIDCTTMVRDDDLLYKDPKQWNTEPSHAVHRQSTYDRIEVREMLRKLAVLNSSSTKPTKKVELLQEMFDCAKTTGGRHLLARELLRLPPDTVKEIIGSHQGLTVLNTWILESVDKEGTQLLRLCMRLLLIVADNLSSIRQTGIGRTVKDKVLGHSCHDIQALANQLGKIWVESSRKGKTPLHTKQQNNCFEQRKSTFIPQPRIENNENRSKFMSHSSVVRDEHEKSRVGMESLAVREAFRVADGSKVSSLSKVSGCPFTSCKIGGEDLRNSHRKVTSQEESGKLLPSWHDRKEVLEALSTEHPGFEEESSSGAAQKELPIILSFRKFARQEQSVGVVTKKKVMVAENADLLDLRDKRPFPAGDEDRKQKVRSWAIDFSLASLLGCLSLTSGCNNGSNISAPASISGHLGGFLEQSMEDLNSPPSVNVKKQRMKLHGIVEDTPLRLDSASKLQIREEQTPSISISGNEQSIGGSQNANESFSGASPHSLRNMVQVRGVSIGSRASSPGSSEAHKETSKGLEIKDAVSEYVRQLLMPLLKTKKLQKDGIKYIHKKTVTKVMERSTELDMAMSVSDFLDTKRKIKIRSLVDKLVERFLEDQYH